MSSRLDEKNLTFRVSGLPAGSTKKEAASIIRQLCDTENDDFESSCSPKIHSLGSDPYSVGHSMEMVATVTFRHIPMALKMSSNVPLKGRVNFRDERIEMGLNFDTTFLGLTPLNDVHLAGGQKPIDCIAVTGLASHAYGSWKNRTSHFMWLRDDAAWRNSNVRVFLYGYDSRLVQSESFQTIEDIGTELGRLLSNTHLSRQDGSGAIRFEPRPIIFIAHSLGGLVVKEAIYKMAVNTDERHRMTAKCVYGLVFFGVPNYGLRIQHWLPMVKDQPNDGVVKSLAPGSEYLLGLQTRFESHFTLPNSKILSIFETMKTPTARRHQDGRWRLDGPSEILVQQASATRPINNPPEDLSLLAMQMNRNHSDLPKFSSRQDMDYKALVSQLTEFWGHANDDVQSRFDTTHPAPFASSGSPGLSAEPFLQLDYSEAQRAAGICFLHYAVDCGKVDIVRWFLSKGADVQKRDSSGETLLHAAVSSGNVETTVLLLAKNADVHATVDGRAPIHCVKAGGHDVLTQLIRAGARINVKNRNGNSALMMAVFGGDVDLVKTLLGRGAEMDAKQPLPGTMTVEGDTELPPISVALLMDHIEVFRILMDKGADLSMTSKKDGHTLLQLAARTGKYKAIECLSPNRTDLEMRDVNGKTALRLAILHDHDRALKVLIRAGANIEALSGRGRTPLHEAAMQGKTKCVRVLLAAGANVDAQTSNSKCTPLHCAAGHGQPRVVKLLLDKRANTESKDSSGETALHLAARTRSKEHVTVIKHLLHCGASMLARADLDEDQCCLLPPQTAVKAGFLEAVKLFLEEGFDIDASDKDGKQLIHHAAFDNHTDILKLLLEREARLDPPAKKKGISPLHVAVFRGHFESADILCKHGANVNLATLRDGDSPLHLAAAGGHSKLVTLLHVDWRAKVNTCNDAKVTPLQTAISNGEAEVVSLLCDYGAGLDKLVTQRLPKGDVPPGVTTALCWAANYNNVGIVSILYDRQRADVNKADKLGWTPLFAAAKMGHTEVVAFLLKKGPDQVNTRCQSSKPWINHNLWTPLHVASANGYAGVVKALLENGADIQATTKDGQKSMDLAALGKHEHLLKILREAGGDYNKREASPPDPGPLPSKKA